MNLEEKKIIINNSLNDRRLELTRILLSETLTCGSEIGILNKEKCEAVVFNCLNGVYSLNELHAISLTLNSFEGFVERLDSYHRVNGNDDKNKHLIKLALELSKLSNLNLTDEMVNEVLDIENPEDCIKYIINKS